MRLIVSVVIAVIAVGVIDLPAQSTYGTILGTAKDSSGAAIAHASVQITNVDENTVREVKTNGDGDYEAPNLLPAHYRVEIATPGFSKFSATGLTLVARQTLRVDATLQVGTTQQTVTVNDSEAGVIATDSQEIQATFDRRALLNLPANIRANGNTSPYQLIQILPGVQADESGNFSIQGGIQSQTQYSLDGISITNVGGNSPLTNAFPSSESISEIKVQGVGNAAEYGQVGDITTVSKSGTNQFHGDLFWYAQNRALNSTAYGQTTKPQLVANDFGASAGGPVLIPHLYNGHDKTFFFGTYEGFRYPRAQTIQNEVPTQAERNGNFNAEGVTIKDPITGSPFPNDTIPTSRISSVALGFLALYPLPNAGDLTKAHSANYIDNRADNYTSDQYDIRVDHYLTSKQSIFGRWTWKNISALNPQNLLVPSESKPDKYKLFVVAHNYAINPTLLNEARFGFTLNDASQILPFDGAKFTNSLGLIGIGPTFPFNGLPDVNISNFQELNTDRGNSTSKNDTWQFTDNVTWNKGRHTFKFGFDYRKIRAVSALGFLSGDNYGYYNFDGSFTGAPFADFLLGAPINTSVDNVKNDNDGRSNHYNAYAQDSFRVNERLTLEYGLRFEFHPGYTDANGNIGNFDPRVPRSGLTTYPDGAQSTLAPEFLQSFNACPQLGSTAGPTINGAPCTPVLSASQAHVPEYLRAAPKRFVPRFGFAYRPFGDKTVFRGGFGVFNTEVLGSIYYALTGTLQSNTRTYNNINSQGKPIFQWPQTQLPGLGAISPLGTAYFGTANQVNWKDPYSMQWDFSIDHDFGNQTGLRISYIGMRTRDLVWSPNLNQSYYSTTYYVNQPLSSRPFPNWGVVNTRANGANANYNSLQVEVNHRLRGGVTFDSTYTFAKNLADNQGYAADHFADENSGHRTMDLYNLKHEYGDVYGTRRQRWITTAIYDLPVGRGRSFGGNMNRFVDAVVGGWQLSSIFLWQSGPYETPYFSGGDPSGTGSGVIGRSQAPDLVGNPNLSNPNRNDWFNLNSFACPATPGWQPGTACLIGSGPGNLPPIGRFGTAGISTVLGPGTVNLNAGLAKYFSITERMRIKIEGSFTNALNHTNLAAPVLAIDSGSVGQITAAQGADFGGYRTGQVGARIEF
jgi:outer membrane receptor protein involved in Fe transport